MTFIDDILEKIYLVNLMRDALMQGIRHPKLLKQFYGLTDEDIQWIREKNPDFFSEKPPSFATIEALNRELKEKLVNTLVNTLKGYMLVLISIHEFIGKKVLGFFRGEPIEDILSSQVVLFSSTPVPWKGPKGKNVAFIGPGVYFARFLKTKILKPIPYAFPIHGIFLSENYLNRKEEIENYDLPLSEKIAIIDFSCKKIYSELVNKISRLLNKYLDAIDALFRSIRSNSVIPENAKHIRFLSLLQELPLRLIFNEKYWEEKVNELKQGLPGIMCVPGLDKFEDLFKIIGLEVIKAKIINSCDVFLKAGHIAIFSILQSK